MTATLRCFHAFTTAALLATLVSVGACDQPDDSSDVDLELVQEGDDLIIPAEVAQIDGWEFMSPAEIAVESAKQLAAPTPETANAGCTLDTFKFRTTTNTIAVTSAPGQLLPPFPLDIPTFDDPVLADGFIAVVTLEDVNGDVVGFGSEQEILDFAELESDTTYTLTIPGRGTLMLEQRESFEILVDTINDMIADQEYQRTFNPPIVEVLTLPGQGKVVGGTGEFAHDHGVWVEIGIIHGIDLINSSFDLEVIIQALHC